MEIYEALKEEYFCMGIQLGARYDGSSLISTELMPPPVSSPFEYIPTSYPGGRAPHLWLKDGSAIFDHFGKYFTLLVLNGSKTSYTSLTEAAKKRGLPLTVFSNDSREVFDLYKAELVIIRPDQYVAWRGNKLSGDPMLLIDMLIGN